MDAAQGSTRVDEARRVSRFVGTLNDFEMVEDLALPYHHMGATITDAVLQAGLRYETTVWPRVQHVMGIPEAATTTGFLAVLSAVLGHNRLDCRNAREIVTRAAAEYAAA